jgi:hypothetical protein
LVIKSMPPLGSEVLVGSDGGVEGAVLAVEAVEEEFEVGPTGTPGSA